MDCHLHSDEVEKIDIDFSNLNPEKLNFLEQLGLYLVGQISRGKLCELWNCGFLTADEIIAAVINGIKDFVPDKEAK